MISHSNLHVCFLLHVSNKADCTWQKFIFCVKIISSQVPISIEFDSDRLDSRQMFILSDFWGDFDIYSLKTTLWDTFCRERAMCAFGHKCLNKWESGQSSESRSYFHVLFAKLSTFYVVPTWVSVMWGTKSYHK